MVRLMGLVILLGIGITLSPIGAQVGDAPSRTEIGKLGKAATALVEIKSKRRYGSAFCVHPSGLFVSNAHIFANDVEGEITLILDASLKSERSFPAKVIRKDTELDLALLRVEGQKELPTLTLGSDTDLSELAELIAFGYPFGTALAVEKGEYPAISLSVGSVTSLRRKAGELSRIQLDAALNPGNSGGPVLDRKGEVVGVVVGGIQGSGVNLAIPVSHIKRFLAKPDLQFSPPTITRANQHLPTVFNARAVSLLPGGKPFTLELALSTPDEKVRKFAMILKNGVYQATAIPVPTSEGPKSLRATVQFTNASLMGSVLDCAFKIGSTEVKLSEVRSLQPGAKGQVMRHDGTSLEGSVTGLDSLAVQLGEQRVTVQLAGASEVRIERPVEIQSVECAVVASVDGAEVGRVSDRLIVPGATSSVARGPQIGSIRPPALSSARTERPLPAPASDVVVGGGGRFLILHLPKTRQLAVFDVNEAKVVKYISVAEDSIRFTAGLDSLVVVLPTTNTIQRWSLKTFERELTVPLDFPATVKAVCMGCASLGPILIGGEANHSGHLTFFDLTTLKPTAIKRTGQGHIHIGDGVFVRASSDGRVFGLWRSQTSPSGLQTLVVTGNEAKGYYQHDSVGHVIPGADGRMIYTALGLFTQQCVMVGSRPRGSGAYLLPAPHGNFYLSLQLGSSRTNQSKSPKVSVHMAGDERPLVTLPDMELMEVNVWDREGFSFDHRLHLLPAAQLIVWVPPSNDRLILHRFDLDEILEKSGIDYLFVASEAPLTARKGSPYVYQLQVKSKKGGVKYRLESGPAGMNISATGKLTWPVPAESANGEVHGIVAVSDGSGQETLHTFTVVVGE